MKTKLHTKLLVLALTLFAMFYISPTAKGQDSRNSVKFNIRNYRMSGDKKVISYDVYLQNINPTDSVIHVAGYTFKAIVAGDTIGRGGKTAYVTNANATLGATVGTGVSYRSSTNMWEMKFLNSTFINSWEMSVLVPKTAPGLFLGTYNIKNTDGTPFKASQSFKTLFSGSTLSTKAMVSLFKENTNTLADGSDNALLQTNFSGFIDTTLTPQKIQLTITSPTLSHTKIYDANDTIIVSKGTVTGMDGSHTSTTQVIARARFGSVDAGTNKQLLVNYTVEGTYAENYLAPVSNVYNDGVITKRQLTLTGNVINPEKVYNGALDATVTTVGTLSGVQGSDVITPTAQASYLTKTIGAAKDITVTFDITGTAASNYIPPVNITYTNGNITAKPLTVSGTTFDKSKVYDRTNAVNITAAGTTSDFIGGDDVSLSAAGIYDDIHVGTGKTITVGYSLSGSDKDNYSVPANTIDNTGAITARPVTINSLNVAKSKVYDGLKSITIAGGDMGTLANTIAEDNITHSVAAEYDTKNVGTNKIIVCTITYSGTNQTDYSLPANPGYTDGIITARSLTPTGLQVATTKSYDGGTSAIISTDATYPEKVSGDDLTVTTSASYTTASVGTGKDITVSFTKSGADSNNYASISDLIVNNNSITPKALTLINYDINEAKTYDGNATATFVASGTLSGIVGVESVNPTVTGYYNSASVGTGKQLTIHTTIAGTDAANYYAPADLTQMDGAINPLKLAVLNTDVVKSKIYDGTDEADINNSGDIQNKVGTEDVTVDAAANYVSTDAGSGKTIHVVYTLKGSQAGNYTAPDNYDLTDGTINRKFNVTVYLEQLWNNSQSKMKKTQDFDYDLEEPFDKFPGDIADTITMELYNAAGSSKILTLPGLYLHQDGQITSAGLSSILIPLAKNGDYLIKLVHRNHLPFSSATALSFNTNEITRSFTNEATANAYQITDGPLPMLISNSKCFMWAGNVYNNPSEPGAYEINDFDPSLIFNNKSSNNGIYGYLLYDLDGNGEVNDVDVYKAFGNRGQIFFYE